MTIAPAATRPPLWWVLVRHEWRLSFRAFGAGRRGPGAKPRKVRGRAWRIAAYVAAAIVLHALGTIALVLPRRWVDTPPSRVGAAAVLLFLFTLMMSMAMTRVVAAFHERRDLDLLLGAPIAPWLILVVRALTVVVTVGALFALFVFPIADVGVASGRWWMARLYVAVPLMAFAATGAALVLTGAVVRLVGVRRARVGLQIFSALIGASTYLVSQARQFLPDGARAWVTGRVRDWSRIDDGPWPVEFAARLADGTAWAWLAFALFATGLFALSVRLARRRFFEIAQSPEADTRVVAPERAAVDRRVAGGFGRSLFATLLSKEWRLIMRAPQLLSQILLQLLYLMPLLFVAFARQGSRMSWSASAFAAGVVGVAGTLAASLAWLTVSAEDAPDLLASSPRRRATLLLSKLVAAVAAPVLLVAIAAIGTLRRSALDAGIVLVFGSLACASAAILAAASPVAGKRTDFQRRHQGRAVSGLIEGMQFLLWGAGAGTAVAGLWIAAVPLTLVACVMPGLRLPRALRQRDAGID